MVFAPSLSLPRFAMGLIFLPPPSTYSRLTLISELGSLIVQFFPHSDIFKVLLSGDKTSAKAVRQPPTVEPFHDITSAAATCNVNTAPATEVMTVAAGGKLGFQLSNSMYHEGPVSIYLGKAPGKVSSWDGSGKSWFKVRPRDSFIVDAATDVSFHLDR